MFHLTSMSTGKKPFKNVTLHLFFIGMKGKEQKTHYYFYLCMKHFF